MQMVRDLAQEVGVDKNVRGAQILIPDTLFLRDGKFETYLALDKDFCLTTDSRNVHNQVKLRMRLEEAIRQ